MKIDVMNLVHNYSTYKVLKDVSFSVDSGEVVSLLGPNGCGKSTTIKIISSLFKPVSGKIKIDGRSIDEIDPVDRAKLNGYVPQYFTYSSYTTVLETVLIGRTPYMSWSVSDEDLAAVDYALRCMNIRDLAERQINELSGGQRQRVFIARAIAQKPVFYLFDEPTSSLDLRYQIDTLTTMRDIIRRDNSGMIVALHDLNLALRYTDKVVLISNGEVYDAGRPADVLTPKAIFEVYGVKAEIIENDKGRFVLAYE